MAEETDPKRFCWCCGAMIVVGAFAFAMAPIKVSGEGPAKLVMAGTGGG